MKKILYSFASLSLIVAAACSQAQQQPAETKADAGSADTPAELVSTRNIAVSKGVIPTMTPMIKVAILLPLSGDSASVGNAMLDAATMALYDSYLAAPSDQIKSQIVLMPRDTSDTPADAIRAAKQAIDQGATFIVGPLFSQAVAAIAPIAREHKVPILTFSNNKGVAGNGVYIFGFLPEQQVQRVADYAFLHNMQRVALLAPNDSYGQKIQESLAAAYLKKGGVLSPTELYAPSPTNIDAAAARIAATYNNAPEERRFQSIFIADGGNQLRNIVSSLKKTNIDLKKVRLVGTGLWEDPDLAKIPELSGAWFSTSPPNNTNDFERRFMSSYHYKPVRLASLAYDAITMLTSVTMSSSQTTINTAALVDPRGFTGPANGLFRLKPDGTNERRLSLMEVTPDGFKIIDPAQKIFEEEAKIKSSATP